LKPVEDPSDLREIEKSDKTILNYNVLSKPRTVVDLYEADLSVNLVVKSKRSLRPRQAVLK
jgi:hypothetical protein